ncbi:MAG: enoyl-CoA hydratase/isomerase family protein [Actinomycetota bacterium]
MSFETLGFEIADGVATVTLNRPEKRNAVNRKMFEELAQAFDDIAISKQIRAFVVTGQGDHFCSGADLSTLDEAPKTPVEMLNRMGEIHQIMKKIVFCPKPGIAAVRGYAAGGGANLALACDLVVMTEDAKFAELFVKRGLVVDMSGTFTLPRTVGLHRAKELALLGDTIDASRAYEMGIANRVVGSEELDVTVKELASRLAAGPPVAMSLMKRALNDSFSQSFDEVLEQEAMNQSIVFSTKDVQEAIMAFFAKRPPNFIGE